MVTVPFVATDSAHVGPGGIRVYRDLFYVPGSFNNRQSLDLYLPANRNEKLPLIIWIHGGAWMGGSKAEPPMHEFVDNGYAFASINYRLTNEAHFPEIFYDCKAAIRYLRAHAKDYNLDPERFGVWGYSAGAVLAALLGTTGDTRDLEGNEGNAEQSSALQAIVCWAGAGDLTKLNDEVKALRAQGVKAKLDIETPQAPLTLYLGGKLEDKVELAKQASASTYITKDDPPFLVVHGKKDDVVPFALSESFAKKLKEAGVTSKFSAVRGLKHFLFHKKYLVEVKDFFDSQFMKKQKVAGDAQSVSNTSKIRNNPQVNGEGSEVTDDVKTENVKAEDLKAEDMKEPAEEPDEAEAHTFAGPTKSSSGPSKEP